MNDRPELLALGISHKTAPVSVREKLALSETQSTQLMQELAGDDSVLEAVTISTCNRTEVYLVANDAMRAESELLSRISRRAGIRPTELAALVYSPRNCDAARQLFRVTSGLESMIIGEAEVQGQVKRSYEAALASGTSGPLTNRLFSAALTTGKRVRTETEIGATRTSVASVAVDAAAQAVGDLAQSNVLVIGAGETSELTAQALTAQGVSTIFVANRHANRARSMAERFGGQVVSLDELPARLHDADIVVSSTASPHAIVGVEELEHVMAGRAGRPLVLIDIAVPRDIEPACDRLPGVTLLDIDDLQSTVARNLSVREGERDRANAIVEEEIRRFARWMGQLDVRPTISALRTYGDEIVSQVLAENAGRWDSASPGDIARAEAMARAIMQRVLHEPTLRLKALSEETSSGHGRLEIARELFGLDVGSEPAATAKPDDASVTPLADRRRATP